MSQGQGNPHADVATSNVGSSTPDWLDQSFDWISDKVGSGVDYLDDIFQRSDRYTGGVMRQLDRISDMGKVINNASNVLGGSDVIDTSAIDRQSGRLENIQGRTQALDDRMQRLKQVLEQRQSKRPKPGDSPVPAKDAVLETIPAPSDAELSRLQRQYPKKRKKRSGKNRFRVID